MFNDFHSRAGAPEAGPFYTLKDHERKLMEKENALNSVVDSDDDISGGEETPLDAPTMVDTAVEALRAHNSMVGTHEHALRSGMAPTEPVPVTVCQHLLITEPMPEPSEVLESSERNMAGQSLLPNLKPYA